MIVVSSVTISYIIFRVANSIAKLDAKLLRATIIYTHNPR